MLQRFGENLPAREVKFAPCDLKRVEADGTFAGYASVFGEVDLGQDLVMPGAFRESLRSRGTQGVKLLFQHDPNEPIGVWLELYEDAKGLFARGRLMPEVARAREVLSLMRAGALDGLSIGFRTVKGRTDPKNGVRRLDKIDLWEISIVTFPMLPEARVSTVKRRGMRLEQFDTGHFARSLRRAASCCARLKRVFVVHPSVASWNTSVQLRRVNYLLRASLVEIKLAQFAYVLGAKFNPNQPRVPAGNPDGGQWTGSGGGGGDRETFTSDAQRLGTQRSGVQLAGGFTEDQKDLTVQGFVSGYCLGSIHSVLPSQFLDMTIAEVMDLANGGDADARTCLKLLGRDRFSK